MNFTANLLQKLASRHLLKHPFYEAWSCGMLSKETLKTYSRQYYHHVEAFPRYISATHSNCSEIENRQVLLENLIDEEKGSQHHPELWLQFSEGLGETRENVKAEKLFPETQNLIDTFFNLSRSSYAEGLGALFAYENQVPEVAASKIDGLKKFYGIDSDKALKFFNVHLHADVYHTEASARLMENLSPEDKLKAQAAAEKAALALWKFLDGVQRETSQT